MKVFVTSYSTKHGVDLSVHATEDLAYEARAATADENWDDEFDGPRPENRTEMSLSYWEHMEGRDYFDVDELPVLGFRKIVALANLVLLHDALSEDGITLENMFYREVTKEIGEEADKDYSAWCLMATRDERIEEGLRLADLIKTPTKIG